MKTQHTPGPWNYRDGTETTWAVYAVLPTAEHLTVELQPRPIAEIPRTDNDERGVAEADANARLIAAAPSLLAALETILSWSEHPDGNLQPPHPSLAQMIADKNSVVRAAIRKATGKD